MIVNKNGEALMYTLTGGCSPCMEATIHDSDLFRFNDLVKEDELEV